MAVGIHKKQDLGTQYARSLRLAQTDLANSTPSLCYIYNIRNLIKWHTFPLRRQFNFSTEIARLMCTRVALSPFETLPLEVIFYPSVIHKRNLLCLLWLWLLVWLILLIAGVSIQNCTWVFKILLNTKATLVLSFWKESELKTPFEVNKPFRSKYFNVNYLCF